MASIESVVLELDARVGKFQTDIQGAATVTDKALARIETASTKMERQVGRSFAAAAQQSRLLGFQIADIGVQLSAGTSPFLVLAQQGPQVANALEGARGAVGRFATFLSGPYGAAVLAATTILGVWLTKNKEVGASVEELVEKMKAQARQSELNERASALFDESLEGLEKAARDAEKALEALESRGKSQEQQTVESIQSSLDKATALREETRALLDAAEAYNERYKGSLASTDPRFASEFTVAQGRIDALREKLEKAGDTAASLQSKLSRALSLRAVEEASRTAEENINARYDAMVEVARRAALASGAVEAALRKEVKAINAAREAELKRHRDTQRERNKSTSDTGDATRFISPVSGGRIRGQFGENRGNRNHAGIDIAVPVGTRVNAPAGGVIIEAGTLPGYGNVVYIDHGRGTISRLAHLSSIGVKKGDIVGQGDLIGLSGGAKGAPGAGNSRGPHVHQELRVNGRPVDPRKGPFPTDPASVYDRAEKAASDEERRLQSHQNEVAALLADEISAKRALTESAEEIAQLRLQEVETERQAYSDNLASLVEQGKITADEAAERRFIADEIAKYRVELIKRNEDIRKFRMEEADRDRAARLDSERRRDEADVLRGQQNLARTLDERNDIERRLIALQYKEEQAANDRLIATYESLKAKKGIAESELAEAKAAAEAARIRNASIGQRRSNDLEGVDRNNPFDRYLDDTADFKARAEEATVRELQSVRDGISEGLAEQLGIKNQYIKDLLSIFLDEVLFRPIAEALRNRQSGGGGLLGGLIKLGSSLLGGGGFTGDGAPGTAGGMDLRGFGRASGGRVNAGQFYRVNEAASPGRVEGFVPDSDGMIIPLGQMNARAAQSSGQTVVNQTFVLDARHGITTPQLLNYVNQTADAAAQKAGGASFAAGQQSTPGTLNKYQQLKG